MNNSPKTSRLIDSTVLKTVLIPVEHGASVMFAESLAVGLWIAWSVNGFLPAIGWLMFFLSGHPLKIVLKDQSHRIWTQRTQAALLLNILLGLLAVFFFFFTAFVSGMNFIIGILAAMPFLMIHLWAVMTSGKKEFMAEFFGAMALGAAAATVILAAGHPPKQAFIIWMVLAVRAMTSVIYVRERLRQTRNQGPEFSLVKFAHGVGLFLLTALVYAHVMKPWIIAAGGLLVARLWFLDHPQTITAKQLGFQESMLGVLYCSLIIFSM